MEKQEVVEGVSKSTSLKYSYEHKWEIDLFKKWTISNKQDTKACSLLAFNAGT